MTASYLAPVQTAYLQKQAAGKTEDMKTAARANDKAAHAELNALRKVECNAECFDCSALKPGWAVLPHGVFICIECAQVHRNLGRHVSQTKAINTGTYLWFDHELPVMRAIGNGVAARAFGAEAQAAKPSRDAPAEQKAAYAHAKYVEHRWGVPQFEKAMALPLQRRAPTPPEPPMPPEHTNIVRTNAFARPAAVTAAVPAKRLPAKPAPAGPPADWDTLFSDDIAAPAPPAPCAKPQPANAASELLALFDPLAMPALPPVTAPPKVAASIPHALPDRLLSPDPVSDNEFFAQFGL